MNWEQKQKEAMVLQRSLYISVAVFAGVVILTLGIFLYNMYLESSIESTRVQKAQIEANIQKVKEDEKVKMYYLVKSNTPFLNKYTMLGAVPKIINNMKILSKTYDINYSNFAYANGEVTSNMFALDDGQSLASAKVVKFFSYFRSPNKDLFDLKSVASFEGQDKITYSVNFKIK